MLCSGCAHQTSGTIVIGSKNFTEQAILGEILAQQIEAQQSPGRAPLRVERRFYLAGTFICQQALLAGRIDLYPEYTGTALTSVLKEPVASDAALVFQRVHDLYAQRFQLQVLPPFGFENTFALVVRGEDARRLGLKTISELGPLASEWRAGFGYEFMERPDGYVGLARAYHLRFRQAPRIMDLGLLYRALLDHQVDVVAGNSTDGLLAARDLAVLADDQHYFPPYDAVAIVRRETLERHPELGPAIAQLAGKISRSDMQRMNYAVDGQHRDAAEVARAFLQALWQH